MSIASLLNLLPEVLIRFIGLSIYSNSPYPNHAFPHLATSVYICTQPINTNLSSYIKPVSRNTNTNNDMPHPHSNNFQLCKKTPHHCSSFVKRLNCQPTLIAKQADRAIPKANYSDGVMRGGFGLGTLIVKETNRYRVKLLVL